MEQHFNLTDAEFEQQFENCTLNPGLFTHEAHIRLAWIHITRYGREQAIHNICRQLKAYVDFLGATAKYNVTLTVAAVKAVSHFVNNSTRSNFKDFIEEFPRLKTHFREMMNTHYQTDIFTSEKARKEYIEPELVPFD